MTAVSSFQYTVDQLLGQVISKFSGQDKVERERISLRYKKEDIVGSNHEKTLGEVLSLDSNAEAATTTVNLFLERVERGGISRDWIIYIKTLTGRIFDLSFYSPQASNTMISFLSNVAIYLSLGDWCDWVEAVN